MSKPRGPHGRPPAGGRGPNAPYNPLHVYTDEEREFLAAVEAYKKQHGVKFPPATCYLKILKAMGYKREGEGDGGTGGLAAPEQGGVG